MEVFKSLYPDINSSVAPVLLDSHTLQIPSNKSFSYTPVMFKPDEYYYNGGVTNVAINEGSSVDEGLDFDRRALFLSNPGIIKNSSGGRPVSEMNQSQVENAIDAFIDQRGGGYKIVTSGWNEAYEGLLEWRLDPFTVPNQCRWAAQRMVAKLAPKGGRYYGTYDGVINIIAPTDDMANCNSLRAPLSDPDAAFDFARNNSGFGSQFLTAEGYKYMHCIVNIYYAGYHEAFKRILRIMSELIIVRNAITSRGVASRICPFAFPGRSEFMNFAQPITLNVEGGTTTCMNFPQYADSVQVIIGYLSLLLGEDPYAWEDTIRRDTNPHYIKKNTNEFHYNGSGAEQIDEIHKYVQGAHATHLETRFAGHDSYMVGLLMYGRSSRWAGQSWSFAPTRKVGQQNWNTAGVTSIVDRSQDRGIFAIVHRYNNRRAIFAFDLGGVYGVSNEYEIDVDGTIVPLVMDGGTYEHRLVNL